MNGACERVGVLMAEWISGELDAADSADVRSHLATCTSCRTEETEMREMLSLLASDAAADSGVRDPGDAYWNGFAARVGTQLRRRKTAPVVARAAWLFDRLPRFATALAAAAVLVIAFNLGRPPARTAAEDPQIAELLVESVAPPSLDGLARFDDADFDRLGSELASVGASSAPVPAVSPEPARVPAPALDGLGELSPEELDDLLERLDAFET